MCWAGATIAHLQRHGDNPASHPQESQTHADCFHSKEKKLHDTPLPLEKENTYTMARTHTTNRRQGLATAEQLAGYTAEEGPGA